MRNLNRTGWHRKKSIPMKTAVIGYSALFLIPLIIFYGLFAIQVENLFWLLDPEIATTFAKTRLVGSSVFISCLCEGLRIL